ncbi:MAG TPA: hypothetical protein PKZ12_00105 [Smithellaceae bacterium]|nr:hypothetical protein [Smithellaceae bacterium]
MKKTFLAVTAVIIIFLLLMETKMWAANYEGPFIPADGTYLGIFKRSSAAIIPDGTLSFRIVIRDSKGSLLNTTAPIKKVEILGQDGTVFKSIPNSAVAYVSFSAEGTEAYTLENLTVWTGYDINFNTVTLPPQGLYTAAIYSDSGVTKTSLVNFRGEKDPIIGYPTQIKYNQSTRTVTWTGTQGQKGYRVSVFKGEKGNSAQADQYIFIGSFKKDDLIKETSFVLPLSVALEAGQKYFITVGSHDSPDNTLQNQNYVHLQDDNSEIAAFTAN